MSKVKQFRSSWTATSCGLLSQSSISPLFRLKKELSSCLALVSCGLMSGEMVWHGAGLFWGIYMSLVASSIWPRQTSTGSDNSWILCSMFTFKLSWKHSLGLKLVMRFTITTGLYDSAAIKLSFTSHNIASQRCTNSDLQPWSNLLLLSRSWLMVSERGWCS